jgi:hypothetical protein
MSDRDLILLIKIIRHLLEEPANAGRHDSFRDSLSNWLNGKGPIPQDASFNRPFTYDAPQAEVSTTSSWPEHDQLLARKNQFIDDILSLQDQLNDMKKTLGQLNRNGNGGTSEAEFDRVLKEYKTIEENLQEQILCMEEMFRMTLNHQVELTEKRVDQVKKEHKEIEEALQEHILANEDMFKLAFQHVDEMIAQKADQIRKEHKQIEEDLQEYIGALEAMMQMSLKHANELVDARVDQARKEHKEVEEMLQEQISSMEEMMKLVLRQAAEDVEIAVDKALKEAKAIEETLQEQFEERLEVAVDKARKEAKAIEETLQEQFEERLEVAVDKARKEAKAIEETLQEQFQEELAHRVDLALKQGKAIEEQLQEQLIVRSQQYHQELQTLQAQLAESRQEVVLLTEKLSQLELVPLIKQEKLHQKAQLAPVEEMAAEMVVNPQEAGRAGAVKVVKKNYIPEEAPGEDDETIRVARQVFHQYLGQAERLKPFFHEAYAAGHHDANPSFFFFREVRGKMYLALVDSGLTGVPSVVFNSIASMTLHHLFTEKRVEEARQVLQEFLKGSQAIYESIGVKAQGKLVASVAIFNKEALEVDFAANQASMAYGVQAPLRTVASQQGTLFTAKLNARKNTRFYLASGSFLSAEGRGLQQNIEELQSLDFTKQSISLSQYIAQSGVENSLVVALKF